MKRAWQRILAGIAVSCGMAVATVAASELVIYGFEDGTEGWVIPDWAKTSADYGVTEMSVSTTQAVEGTSSLEIRADFPGGQWSGAYVERQVEVTDWTPFSRLVVSIYAPSDAPPGLLGRIILTVGNEWTWTEMNRAIPLKPGEWTELSVNLKPGSMDWKFFPDEEFRKSVRKIGIRIESDKEPAYHGSVFVDNVRVVE